MFININMLDHYYCLHTPDVNQNPLLQWRKKIKIK